ATSAAPAVTVTPPTLAAASRAAALVSCTISRTPAFARLLAMGKPMVPSPMNPTVSFMRGSSGRCKSARSLSGREPRRRDDRFGAGHRGGAIEAVAGESDRAMADAPRETEGHRGQGDHERA